MKPSEPGRADLKSYLLVVGGTPRLRYRSASPAVTLSAVRQAPRAGLAVVMRNRRFVATAVVFVTTRVPSWVAPGSQRIGVALSAGRVANVVRTRSCRTSVIRAALAFIILILPGRVLVWEP